MASTEAEPPAPERCHVQEDRAKRIADLSLPLGTERTFIIPHGAPIGNARSALSADRAARAGRAAVIYVTPSMR